VRVTAEKNVRCWLRKLAICELVDVRIGFCVNVFGGDEIRWRSSRHVSIPFLPGHLRYGESPMQSVPAWMYEAWMYEAMAIVAFAMGILVLLLGLTLIMRAFWGKSPAKSPAKSDAVTPAAETGTAGPIEAAAPGAATTRASTRAAITIILGGGLIWLGGEV
jgi:hypothetical protein